MIAIESIDATNVGFARMTAAAKAAKVAARAVTFGEAIAAAKASDDVRALDMLSKIRAMASRIPFTVPADTHIDPVKLQNEIVAAGMDVEDRLSLKTMLLRAKLLEP
jgi:ribulose 1,5-bisphosphate synthetase/thiazole synthase